MDTMTLTLNHASVPCCLYGSPSLRSGSASTARGSLRRPSHFAQVGRPKGWQVLAIDLPGHWAPARPGSSPGTLSPELRACSPCPDRSGTAWPPGPSALGAWFSLAGLSGPPPGPSPLRLPGAGHGRLIQEMMSWAGVTESRLESGEISTEFSETLSWPLSPVRPCPPCLPLGDPHPSSGPKGPSWYPRTQWTALPAACCS